MKTPITYWGGKQQIAGKVIKLFPAHRIYNEPFFGGVLFSLQNVLQKLSLLMT